MKSLHVSTRCSADSITSWCGANLGVAYSVSTMPDQVVVYDEQSPMTTAQLSALEAALLNGSISVLTWDDIEVQRDKLLTDSDWTQLLDYPQGAQQRGQWKQYRDQLRSITQDFQNPDSVVWPTPPGSSRRGAAHK